MAESIQDQKARDDAHLRSLGIKPELRRTLGFLSNFAVAFTYLGELVSADRLAEQKYHEIDVRANTGLGAAGSATAMSGGE